MLSLTSEEQDYVSDIIASTTDSTTQSSFRDGFHAFQQRVFYLGMESPNAHDASIILKQHQADASAGRRSICVIENISPAWIARLGLAWNIDKDFFLQHASNPGGDGLWESVMGRHAREQAWITSTIGTSRRNSGVPMGRKHYFIEGILQHANQHNWKYGGSRVQRRFHFDQQHGWQANTRISYYRVSAHSYLFLVDAPFSISISDDMPLSKPGLRVPYSQNRSGLCIPHIFSSPHYSTFEALQAVFSLGWSLKSLFSGDYAIDFVAFSSFFVATLWVINLRFLDRSIKSIAFKDVRRPSVRINDILHNKRRDLDHLRSEIAKTKTWIPPELEQFSESLQDRRSRSPMAALEGVYEESGNLERFLMDTFQLLMSSISVLDSQTSIKEARRSALLTQLATVYIPLSFVTGVFGMNVKEINGSPVSVWVCCVTLAVVGGLTAVGLWVSRKCQEKHWVESANGVRMGKKDNWRRNTRLGFGSMIDTTDKKAAERKKDSMEV